MLLAVTRKSDVHIGGEKAKDRLKITSYYRKLTTIIQ